MQTHVPLHRRRREGVTDYRARKKAISSKSPLLVVRISNKNVVAQFVRPAVKGDSVLASAHSHQLRKLGWKGSLKSTPAAYLLGMIAGQAASAKGIKEAVLYNGLTPFVSGGRIPAFVKGVIDAGVSIPAGEDSLPDEERIKGKTIGDYAAKLSSEDKEAYQRSFSAMLKAGFKPEDYENEFTKMKSAIQGGKK